jgi:hypothetical protein
MPKHQKFLTLLFKKLQRQCSEKALLQMWNEGLLNLKAIEKLYVCHEIERRVRDGEHKTKAMEQLADELSCSYEKIRAIVYGK